MASPEPTPRRWEHKPGDRYVCIVRSIVGNETDGFHTTSDYYSPSQATIVGAWRRGLRELDRSDDFNLGVIRNGQLIALLWQDEIVDDDPEEIAEIAEDCGL